MATLNPAQLSQLSQNSTVPSFVARTPGRHAIDGAAEAAANAADAFVCTHMSARVSCGAMCVAWLPHGVDGSGGRRRRLGPVRAFHQCNVHTQMENI